MSFRTIEISSQAEIHIRSCQMNIEKDEGHARQSKLMHAQIAYSKEKYVKLWEEIVTQKINNQARALSCHGRPGSIRMYGFKLRLTEKQYAKCFYLTGEPDYQENTVGPKSHIML